jgi:glycosyltransferase 2 family protein
MVLLVSAAAAYLAIPALAGAPALLTRGCGHWIAAAGTLELISAGGFVILFKLVFASPLGWRRSVPAAMRALAASTVLPGGGLIGPALGAWSATPGKPSRSQLTRSTITFVILTNAPGATVLAAVGLLLWLGFVGGPQHAALTLLPALLAAGLLCIAWFAGRAHHRPSPRHPLPATLRRALIGGVGDTRTLVRARNWKLFGAIVYYAFDNAVLWAAFHAFGPTPPIAVIVMGYLVGSLAGALPLPGGLGALDGGLIGALVLYGSPAAPAAAAVLLYHGISLLVPLALGALGLVWTPRRVRARRLTRRVAPELAAARFNRS